MAYPNIWNRSRLGNPREKPRFKFVREPRGDPQSCGLWGAMCHVFSFVQVFLILLKIAQRVFSYIFETFLVRFMSKKMYLTFLCLYNPGRAAGGWPHSLSFRIGRRLCAQPPWRCPWALFPLPLLVASSFAMRTFAEVQKLCWYHGLALTRNLFFDDHWQFSFGIRIAYTLNRKGKINIGFMIISSNWWDNFFSLYYDLVYLKWSIINRKII